MNKLRFLVISLALALAACNSTSPPDAGGSGPTLHCMHPGDCFSGNECCVTYSANFGGQASSQCQAVGTCQFSGFTEGVVGTACDSDADCKHPGVDGDVDAGTHKIVCSPLAGVSGLGVCVLQ